MKRSPVSAVCAILALLTLVGGFPALAARPAEAATVFSNYTGVNCLCGFGEGFYAEGFTPTIDFDFAGAASFVRNTGDEGPQSFSMALYSSNAGLPGSALWTSGTLTAPGPDNTATLVNASYAGSPILLTSGHEYFLVLNTPDSDSPSWLAQGSSSAPLFGSSDGTSWNNLSPGNLQFEVSGAAPGAIVPEPASWVMVLLGFGLVGFAASRRARKEPARCCGA
jgi:PEP-CTERM motif